MRKILTVTIISVLISSAYASSTRTSTLLADDSFERLSKIAEITKVVEENEVALNALQVTLSEELIKAKKQKTAKIILGVGAAGLTTVALLIKFPFNSTGGKIGTLGDAMLTAKVAATVGVVSTAVTATGATKYLLNLNDAEELTEKVRLAKISNNEYQKSLIKEIVQLCKIDARHKICY